MRSLLPLFTLMALAAVAALAGCGSTSNGALTSKPPNEIVGTSVSSAMHAQSVHVSGWVVDQGSAVELDLELVAGKGGRGTMSFSGFRVQIIGAASQLYVKASSAFWAHFASMSAAQLFGGKWLKAHANGSLAEFARMTDLHALLSDVIGHHGKLTAGAVTTLGGQKVIPITDTTEGGTLYVTATGPPYPVELVKSGSAGGRIRFDRYNEPVSLNTPANALDITKLQAGPIFSQT